MEDHDALRGGGKVVPLRPKSIDDGEIRLGPVRVEPLTAAQEAESPPRSEPPTAEEWLRPNKRHPVRRSTPNQRRPDVAISRSCCSASGTVIASFAAAEGSVRSGRAAQAGSHQFQRPNS